jgi:hypothetical protein
VNLVDFTSQRLMAQTSTTYYTIGVEDFRKILIADSLRGL